MATPANPLDKFASYTYHFELHAGTNWAELLKLEKKLSDAATDRFTPNGTLVINTRKDAHQVIDDVKFEMCAPAASPSELLMPQGDIELTVIEPGGFSFLEKLEAVKTQNKVTNLVEGGLMWVLKIIFVGRRPDNSIEILQPRLLPMMLQGDMTATFDHRGGSYHMRFVYNSTAGSAMHSPKAVQMNLAYVHKNISFPASTVTEALTTLQDRLNSGYAEIYKYEGQSTGKPISYSITYDARIAGSVTGLSKNTNAPGEPKIFTFNPNVQIGSFIQTILMSSPELLEKIGASRPSLDQQFHPGIFIPYVIPSVTPYADKVVISYYIGLIDDSNGDNKFIFDYYFADAGKNVDVMHYDVKFQNASSWIQKLATSGHDYAVNASSTMPKEHTTPYAQNIVHPDITKPTNFVEVQRTKTVFNENDAKIQPTVSSGSRVGFNSTPVSLVSTLRTGIDSIAYFQTAIDQQQVFEIRGHLMLLDGSFSYPDGSYNGVCFNGVWIKVNIYMPDGKGGKRQFFYQDYYRLNAITSTFSRGMFTQQLIVIMVNRENSQ